MIVVIPTGGSNLGSIDASLSRLNADFLISENQDEIRRAEKIILPGVGHAQSMMERLQQKGLHELIPRITQPVLGICLGMQLLFESSEEGDVELLHIIPGRVIAMPARGLALPHMGWNRVEARAGDRLSLSADQQYFYFVHSFMADDGPWTRAQTDYGGPVPAIIQWRNFFGTQFHPERSGTAGSAWLAEFLCKNP